MKIAVSIVGVGVFAGGAALWYSVYGKAFKGEFVVVNKAKEPVVHAVVTVCGQTTELRDLRPAMSAPGSFRPNCEGHYTLEAELQSGKKFHKETGYVTSGFDFRDEIVVTDSGVDIVDSKAQGKR